MALRLGPTVDGSLVGLLLRPVRYRVYASPRYLRAHGRPRVPADLAGCECLRFAQSPYRDVWTFEDAKGRREAVRVQGWLSVNTATALHRAALDGLGPVLLADLLAKDDVAEGRLVDLFPQHTIQPVSPASSIWLLYASRAFLSRRMRTVVDFLRQRLGAPGPQA